jgi:hypothetical protein
MGLPTTVKNTFKSKAAASTVLGRYPPAQEPQMLIQQRHTQPRRRLPRTSLRTDQAQVE